MIDRTFPVVAVLGMTWWQDPAHAATALAGGALSALLVALYFEWAMRRYQRALDRKLDEMRSFDTAISLQAGRLTAVETQIRELRDDLRKHRDSPQAWDIGPGHRR